MVGQKISYAKSILFRRAAWLALPFFSLFLILLLYSCNIIQPDFSKYSKTNLIPEATLDKWLPPSHTTIGAPGSVYMDYERVDDDSDAPNPFGAGDTADLYSGLPASLAAANPQVYRLEIKNLFQFGDFEGAAMSLPTISPGSTGTYLNADSSFVVEDGNSNGDPTVAIVSDPTFTHTNSSGTNVLRITTLVSSDHAYFDLSKPSIMSEPVGPSRTYNLSFLFRLPVSPIYLSWGSIVSSPTLLKIRYNDEIGDIDNVKSFPLETKADSKSSNFATGATAGESILAINPLYPNSTFPITQLISSFELDDIKIIRTDIDYRIAFMVPFKLKNPDGTEARPKLMPGGTYTLKVYVRRDPSSIGVGKQPNRFVPNAISLGITDYSLGTPTAGGSQAFNASSHNNWNGWQLLTLNVKNVLTGFDVVNLASDSSPMLKLEISATDDQRSSQYFPGSILIAAPQLNWSPY